MTDYALEDLRPAEVESYLESRHWTFVREVTNGSIWVAEQAAPGDSVDVFVPHEISFGDYARRLREVVETVSLVERRADSEVIRDLVETAADVVRFRLPHTFVDESVRLSDALTLFQRARQAMRAAALSAVEPKPVHASSAPYQVESFLNRLRLGHTERGSYVIRVICPLGTVEAPPGELGPRTDEPFGRFATVGLSSALSAMDEALAATRQGDDLRPFADAIPRGVSSDLCDAVGELTRAGRAHSEGDRDEVAQVTIHFSWSPTRPVRADVRSSFSIAEADVPLLQDAAKFLKTVVPRPRVTIIGHVVRLERQESQPDGSIGIKGDLGDGHERVVVVRLTPTDYAQALHAHDKRLLVACTGVLERRGTHWVLAEPVEFRAPEGLF